MKAWAFRGDVYGLRHRPALSLRAADGFNHVVWIGGDDMLARSASDALALARSMRLFLESEGWA